jgi:hypothetical protein
LPGFVNITDLKEEREVCTENTWVPGTMARIVHVVRKGLGSLLVMAAITTATAYAQSDHYVPGLYNIRDLALPESGLYGAVYNYGYLTDDLKDSSGNKLTSVTITGPGGRLSTTINVKVNLDLYALVPAVIWVPKWKLLDAKYGLMIAPSFANASLGATLSRTEGAGASAAKGQFNIGDTFIVPLWLDWSGKKYDVGFNYGFYIPTGKYTLNTVNVPIVGPVRVASPDNIGLGFWENQTQFIDYYYPWEDRRMAIENVLTWEIDQHTRGTDLTQGQYVTWNWGISQFLPLKKDKSLLAEIGPAGYGNFQVSDNTGTDVRNPGDHERAWGAGVQIGVTAPKRPVVFNFKWFHEFAVVNRFEGTVLSLSLTARL